MLKKYGRMIKVGYRTELDKIRDCQMENGLD